MSRSLSHLDSHPIQHYAKPAGDLAEVECCSICLEPPSNLVKAPCKHSFCNECLTQWLLTQTTCPHADILCEHNGSDDLELEESDRELSFAIIDTGEIPENIYDKIEHRVEDLVENIFYNNDLKYRWSLDNDSGYYTKIKRRGTSYTVRLNILSTRTNRYIKYIFPEITTEYYNIGKQAKKEKTKKHKTESWRYKNNKNRKFKTR